MTDESDKPELIAKQIKRYILNGKSLWSFIGFLIFSVVLIIFLLMIALLAFDFTWALSRLGPSFNIVVSEDPNRLGSWISEIAPKFDGLRGSATLTPEVWGASAILIALFFLVSYSTIPPLKGASMLAEPTSAPVVRVVLDQFGYFKDIVSRKNGDYLSHKKKLYVARRNVSQIIKCKPSDEEQKILLFFMSHEYAHVPTFDNAVHSFFVILFNLVVISSAYLLLWLLIATTILIVPTSLQNSLYTILFLIVFVTFFSSIIMCVYGVLSSYMKAREYFADRAAFEVFKKLENPYSFYGTTKRPAIFSAFYKTKMFPYERKMHEQHVSHHARNLLIFFWPTFVLIRCLYLMSAPASMELFVLVFDAFALFAFIILCWALPPYTKQIYLRPLTPWVISTIALIGLVFSTNGVLGVIKGEFPTLLSNKFLILIGLPTALITFVFLVCTIFLALNRLINRWTLNKRENSHVLLTIGLWFMMSVGRLISYLWLVFCIGLLTSWITGSLQGKYPGELNMPPSYFYFIFLLFMIYVPIQFLNLTLLKTWIYWLEAIVSSVIVGVLGAFLFVLILELAAPSLEDKTQMMQSPDISFLVLRYLNENTLISLLPQISLIAVFYLIFRGCEYWARSRMRSL